jgi:poly(3-hydroxybutyrate) depolymerase
MHRTTPRVNMTNRLSLYAAALLSAAPFLHGEVLQKTKKVAGLTIEYKVVLPNNYDAAKAYPGVLAFPGGGQNMGIVSSMIERNWRPEAEKRGYIVVMPAAPNGVLYFEGSEKIFPEFLKMIMADYKIQGGKFHIAGVSNGGISAFHIAAQHPEYFLTLTGLPGYLIDATPDRIKAISKMCINMHVGELDSGWREDMSKQAKVFQAKGMKVHFTVEPGQGHVMRTLEGPGSARLFDQFEEIKKGCGK